MSDNERFKKRKIFVKVIWSVCFAISVIITIILFSKNSDSLAAYIFIYWDVFCGLFCLASLLGVKFHTYTYKNHEISLYIGWTAYYLLLDGIIVDKCSPSLFGGSSLECDFEGEKVCLKVRAFGYTLRVGNNILH